MPNIVVFAWSIINPILFIFLFHSLLAETLSPSQESRCLSCIRNVTNILGIDVGKRCEGYYCGHYQLSYTYWAEAGKPGNHQGSRDYEKCARDKECSEQTVKAYFRKYKRDCNNDGVVDCLDIAALHKGGPVSCTSAWFYRSRYWLAFNKTTCMVNREQEGTKIGEDDSKDLDAVPQRVLKNQTLTQECLDCICDAVSGCNVSVNNCGSGTVCGPFAISQAYWKDGRRPGTSWTACTRTKECAGVTVKNYMEKHKKDCNGDGVITCEDYAAIHRRGPNFCSNRDLQKEHYWNKFLSCRANQKPNKDVNLVKVGDANDDQSPLVSRVEVSSTASSQTTSPIPQRSTDITNLPEASESSSSTSNSASAVPQRHQRPSYALASIKFDMTESRPSSTREYSSQAQTSTTRLLDPKPASLVPFDQQADVNSGKFDYTHQDSETTPYQPSTAYRDYRETTARRESVDHGRLPIIIVSKPLGPFRSPTYTTSMMSTVTSTTRQPTTVAASTSSTNSKPSMGTTSVESRTTTRLQASSGEGVQSPVISNAFSSAAPSDKPMTAPVNVEEADYMSNEFPYSNPPDRTSNFDKVVIGIVGNPEFTRSYPPIPEIAATNTHDINATDNAKDQGPDSKSIQKSVGTNQRGPTWSGANRLPTTHETEKTTVKNLPKDYTATPSSKASEATPKLQTDRSNVPDLANTQDVASALGIDPLNLTGISEFKGLNETNRIPMDCLECICDASSNCDATVQCISKQREKNRCGMYMISWNQFQESDISLTSLATIPPGLNEETADERFYYECSTDKNCAEKLIHLYIEKHQRDCNNDGKIDCYDIAAIHRVGPKNCNSSKFLSSQYWKDFKNCHTADSSTTTVQPSI